MKIEKAIEILELSLTRDFDGCSDDLIAADRLGIEALKLIQHQSPNRKLPGTKLLPGETTEDGALKSLSE